MTLTVEAVLYERCYESLGPLTSHIETLVLEDIYDEDDELQSDLASHPRFPKMELPGLKKIEVAGRHLPSRYILTCFSAMCNSKLPSISLWMTRCKTIGLVQLVGHPIFRNVHTIDIDTGESTNYFI